MKLVVQIPCYNEAGDLPRVVASIPRTIEGVDEIEILVIDDGSTDDTSGVARSCGVDHVVRHVRNRGLVVAFMTGLDVAVSLGADLIVNIDGDAQYRGEDVPKLIAPILDGSCEFVVGVRPLDEFVATKKWLQRVGSRVVQQLAGVKVADATSGFRAMTRDVALQLNIASSFTYTLESLIQCGHRGIAVGTVPISTNPTMRASRLFGSNFEYVWRSIWTMLRIHTWHVPLPLFWFLGAAIALGGFLLGVRFFFFFLTGEGGGHVQSLLLGVAMLVIGVQVILTGLIADLVAANRRNHEELLYRARRRDADWRQRSSAGPKVP